jgi:GTPase-associated protein 1, N-terminal domain type 2
MAAIPVAGRIDGAAPLVADQILVTHCLKEDSVLGQGGFSVRAASTSGASLLTWARQLDPYELPVEMQRGLVRISETPRRLALVPAPGNRMALVHTAYLPGDTCTPPRPHSFITHALVYPRLDARSSAAAWNSPDWRECEVERGAPKSLKPLDGVPMGSLVHDQAVTDFLSSAYAPVDQDVSSVVFSSRFETEPEARQGCLKATLHGFLRTFEPGAVRNRVYIMAEPGTVALLAYAITRLLPPQFADAFWFSTYEPLHTSFRENKVARLVGSYTPRPCDRSETERLRRGGYVVDMLRTPPIAAPELGVAVPGWPLEDLLALAEAGDWPAIDEIHMSYRR